MDLHPLAALMRRYAFAYTAAHEFDVCRELMVDDYLLRMGPLEIKGREEAYIPATERQYRQFPGLGFTVHEFVNNGDRGALHFTEHGRSTKNGACAAWSGISLYRWDGRRLVECRVEQDYFSRRRQLAMGEPDPVAPPGHDPWCGEVHTADETTEEAARQWLRSGAVLGGDTVFDDEWCRLPVRPNLEMGEVQVLDLLSAGPRVAFHAAVVGSYHGGLPDTDDLVGREGTLYLSGMARVVDGVVTDAKAVSDRLAFERRLSGRV